MELKNSASKLKRADSGVELKDGIRIFYVKLRVQPILSNCPSVKAEQTGCIEQRNVDKPCSISANHPLYHSIKYVSTYMLLYH